MRYAIFILATTVLYHELAVAAPLTVALPGNLSRQVAVHGTVYGIVDGKRETISGASVEIESPSLDFVHRVVASVVTDSLGRYTITNPLPEAGSTLVYDVQPGRYSLFASYRSTRHSAGNINIDSTSTQTKDINLGVLVRSGGAAPPPPTPTYYATDRLLNTGAVSIQALFQNTRLIDPCSPIPDCMMSYGMAAPTGPLFGTFTRADNVHGVVELIRATPQFSNASSILVFIHGYNNDFFSPFELGATWLASFDPSEPVLVYSWPSSHVTAKYLDDETNNTWAQDHFRDFMLALMRDPAGPPTVNIFAHSMGNRLALGFLDYLASAKPTTVCHIGQVIFAAPDVDSATFFEAIPRIALVADGLTLYGSSHDNALRLSRDLHGHCRAGLVNCDYAIPAVSNFNAIDASIFHCDFLGHGYWVSSDTLHADFSAVLRNGVMKGGDLRPNIRSAGSLSSYVFASVPSDDHSCQAEATGT